MSEELDTDWVWTMPNIGTPWCNCGRDPLTGQPLHHVTRALVSRHVLEVFGEMPDELSNTDISKIVLSLWKRPDITPVMADTLLASVTAVVGEVREVYNIHTAIAVVKHFSMTVDMGEQAG